MKTFAVLASCLLGLLFQPAGAATVTQVMWNLDNPRGLAFGPDGGLYVVEAGRGGAGPCAVLRGLPRCYGPSGAVTRLLDGEQNRVVTGLPSYSDAGYTEVTGPHDVGFAGPGRMYITVGFGGNPAERELFGPVGANFGTLLYVPGRLPWRIVTDVSAHESASNPAGGPIDSNPYGLLAGQRERWIADAGANALLRVAGDGAVSTIASFRSRPSAMNDAVPTSVVQGPDGAFYVGELTGAPFPAGDARVYRVVPGEAPTVFHAGFKTIIDLDFGPDGSLYVLEHATGPVFFGGPGQVVKVAPNGTRSVVVGGLTRPTSILAGDSGELYVSNQGVSLLTGEVLRIDP